MTDTRPEERVLQCPTCGFDFLHHDRVTTHSRDEDCIADVHVVDIPDDGTARPIGPAPNPSDRRSGVVIEGWCEACGERWTLTVAQQKGQTMFAFGHDD